MNLQWTKKLGNGTSKKYGLVKSGPAKPSIFQVDASTEQSKDESKPKDIMKQTMESERRRAQARATQRSLEALAQDASCFQYDDVYDSMTATRRVGATHKEKSARYIPKLQQAAKIREIEFDRVYERQLLKEQQADAPSERYVTAAYKKQLQESRKWDAEDAVRTEAVEKATTAESAGMHAFYSNLLTKNIATGADVDSNAVSAYTHGSIRNKTMLQEEQDTIESDVKKRSIPSQPVLEDKQVLPDHRRELLQIEEHKQQPETVVETQQQDSSSHIVSAARERYLARKRAKLSSSQRILYVDD
mmetsp:Transcript_17291/g.26036  ORF Transcript_17291/g.26036 Transcript_17291/m.26036 type:complete len:303 (+) Transcript_17291:55-963(+)